MSAFKLNDGFKFTGESESYLYLKVNEMIKNDKDCKGRVDNILQELEYSFIEELPEACIRFIIKMEDSLSKGTFKDEFIQNSFESGSLEISSIVH